MYLIRGQNNIKLFKKRFPEISLSATIGNFDGMHLGHKAILEKVKKNAKETEEKDKAHFDRTDLTTCLLNRGQTNTLILWKIIRC